MAHAYAHAPYYRDLMTKAKLGPATAMPHDFPPLAKTTLLEHYDGILTVPGMNLRRILAFLDEDRDPLTLMDGRYYVIHTWGSSGTVLPVVWDEAAWLHGCSPFFRLFRPRLWERTVFLGAVQGHFAGISMMVDHQRGVCPWFTRFTPIDIAQPLAQVLAAVAAARPKVIVAYPAALRMLAEAQVAGRIRLRPRIMLSSGEALRRADAASLTEVFGIAPMDVYASSEHLVMGYRARREMPLTFCTDRMFIEVEATRTLVTNYTNRVLPLIRYVMGDIVTSEAEEKDAIIGWQEHTPWFINDDGEWDSIHPIVFVEFYVPGLRSFQCELRGERAFLFRIQCDPSLTAAECEGVRAATRRRLHEILGAKRDGDADHDVEVVAAWIRSKDGEISFDFREAWVGCSPCSGWILFSAGFSFRTGERERCPLSDTGPVPCFLACVLSNWTENGVRGQESGFCSPQRTSVLKSERD